jgi:hypothetical protein
MVKMGIPFDPEKKYLGGKHGDYIGKPGKPNYLKIDMDGLEKPESILMI